MVRRIAIRGVILAIVAGTWAVAQTARSFTLEQVMSAPFPSDLVAAPTGGSVAWVFNDRGVRNVWVASPPQYQGRALTANSEDDGQEIESLEVRAGRQESRLRTRRRRESQRRVPQPLEPARGLRAGGLLGAAVRRLRAGKSPRDTRPRSLRGATGSRTSRRIRSGSRRSTGDDKPSQALHARGTCRNLRWSPDGARLAFVSGRGDHSFIGVYDPATQSVTYLDPSTDDDDDPAWSPDCKSVAFRRTPASLELQTFRPHRESQPWSIRVADLAGRGREIFRASPGRGSVFRDVVADDEIFWADGNRIVFPWEKDGWTHLYSVPAGAGPALLLTPGDFEVEYVSLSADRKRVLFNSNQGDIERRHIWSVPAEGGKPVALTSGAGIEWRPVESSDGRAVVYFRSGARRPPEPVIAVANEAARPLAAETIPAEFPQNALVEPQAVIFSATDGMKIHGQLFLPEGIKAGERRPAAIFFHGGSRRQMLVGWHYNYYYRNAYAMNQYLASRGYVVLSVNYRSGIGYGMEFREALDYGATGASEYNDVVGAGLYLASRPDVDGSRIGLWGGSYGGYLTALGLARASELFAAGVDLHGVHDWNDVIHNFEPDYEPAKKRGRGETGVFVLADGVRQDLEVASPAHPRRRRPQCSVQPERHARGSAAPAGGRCRAARVPGRDPRLSRASPLARCLPCGERFHGPKARNARAARTAGQRLAVTERVVFSTEKGRICPGCGWPQDDCHCSSSLEPVSEAVPEKITARLRLENRASGKSVTVVDGLPRNSGFLEILSKEWKRACGTGGHAGDGAIELQGDQRERLRDLLARKGWTVKG